MAGLDMFYPKGRNDVPAPHGPLNNGCENLGEYQKFFNDVLRELPNVQVEPVPEIKSPHRMADTKICHVDPTRKLDGADLYNILRVINKSNLKKRVDWRSHQIMLDFIENDVINTDDVVSKIREAILRLS